MSHYLIAQLNGGRYEGARVLSAEGISEMLRGNARIDGDSYAMGWVENEKNGVHTVWHEGSTGDFNANMYLVPEDKWGIVLLTNGDDLLQAQRMDQIPIGVMNLLLDRQPPPMPLEEFFVILLVMLGGLLLQAVGIVRSVVLLRRWRADPARRPHGVMRIAPRVMVPLVLSLIWASICLVILPALTGSPLRTLPYSDVGLVVVFSGGVALVWGAILRPALVLLMLRTNEAT